MESHEGLVQLIIIAALNILLIKVGRHRVVDVKQCHRILADAGADELAEGPVDIHLTGNRDAPSGKAAVHITRHEAKLGLECRPAFPGDRHVFAVASVRLDPV